MKAPNCTFYSWKDTAARDMIWAGFSAIEIMVHFRHKDLNTTQKYMRSFQKANKRVEEWNPE